MKNLEHLKEIIGIVPNFPKPGINFLDITPLFLNPQELSQVIDNMAEFALENKIDVIVGAESRGFLFAAPLSLKTNLPFVLARKPNKLPRETYKASYTLEYGSSTIEMCKGDLKPNQRVLIVDDLLATGGTVGAIENLVNQAGAKVAAYAFLIELDFLKGRDTLKAPAYSVLHYDD